MCGIVGVLSRDRDPALLERTVVAMRDEMRHRGPDDAGVTVLRDGERLLALGHRRLSIIDLSPLGHQPMSTADGSHWIVFNGEIFNYQELRRQLPASVQASFRSQSDTEVILYAAREWGVEECLRRLRGMYAFALYDVRKGLLTLVRDPLGVKPLYYVDQQGALPLRLKSRPCWPCLVSPERFTRSRSITTSRLPMLPPPTPFSSTCGSWKPAAVSRWIGKGGWNSIDFGIPRRTQPRRRT